MGWNLILIWFFFLFLFCLVEKWRKNGLVWSSYILFCFVMSSCFVCPIALLAYCDLRVFSQYWFPFSISAKGGDVWHIGCYQTVQEDPNDPSKFITHNDIHVHVLEDDILSVKNGNTVLGITKHSIIWFAIAHKGRFKKLSIRMDNAGCYHCQTTIQGLYSLRPFFKQHGIELMGIHFNEPGKFLKHFL